LGVCSYTITGPGAVAAAGGALTSSSSLPPLLATRGLLVGRGGDDDAVVPGRLSGSGLGPCRLLMTPLLAFAAAADMVVLCCIIGRSR
jgi:hypothetical protein